MLVTKWPAIGVLDTENLLEFLLIKEPNQNKPMSKSKKQPIPTAWNWCIAAKTIFPG
jgi:hypothetical protein